MGQIDEMSYPSMFTDVVKQLTSRHILHDHEEIGGRAYHLVPKTHTFQRALHLFYI